uniref:Major facilitator superfamily (MFS) profile domain-containing protein n=1 Tax=Aegilops tauschii subsp. strangulata TaxID=200361 RepID=A0A453KQB6_AEGTS
RGELLSEMGPAVAWEERRTLVLVNLASIMERADEALLPAVYREVGAALHATPTGLGALTLYRSIVQAACYPLAAYAASRHNRAHVIAVGAFLWAAATFLVAISETFLQVAISRGLNGIGLALVIPAVQSLVADSTDDDHRGTAFGWLQLTSSIGSIIGGFSALLLAPTTIFGVEGWRFAFHLVAAISVVVGALVWFFAVDPNFRTDVASAAEKRSAWDEARELLREAKSPRGYRRLHDDVLRRDVPGRPPRRQDGRRPRPAVPERREDRAVPDQRRLGRASGRHPAPRPPG